MVGAWKVLVLIILHILFQKNKTFLCFLLVLGNRIIDYTHLEEHHPLRRAKLGDCSVMCSAAEMMPISCCGIVHQGRQPHSPASQDHLQPLPEPSGKHFSGKIWTDGDISQLQSPSQETWHIQASFALWRNMTFKEVKDQLYESQQRREAEKVWLGESFVVTSSWNWQHTLKAKWLSQGNLKRC